MSAALKTLITPEDYLLLEQVAQSRSEFSNGEIYAMAGASRTHNKIAMNIASYLHGLMRGKPCEVYQSDMRVSPHASAYYYPDVVVACQKIHFLNEKEDTLLNPVVLFEVLSPSTSNYDRGEKFLACRTIKSLKDYVVISQDRVLVEHHRRQPDGWLLQERRTLQEVIRLESLSLEIPLQLIYDGLEVPTEVMVGLDR